VHWNTITTIAGIRHITIQSMSERFTTMPEPAAAFAMLDISESELDLVVHGEDPFAVRMPFRASGVRPWMQPTGPFSRRDAAPELEVLDA
jgi:3',5'-cyclic-AMP phosphodiesterase